LTYIEFIPTQFTSIQWAFRVTEHAPREHWSHDDEFQANNRVKCYRPTSFVTMGLGWKLVKENSIFGNITMALHIQKNRKLVGIAGCIQESRKHAGSDVKLKSVAQIRLVGLIVYCATQVALPEEQSNQKCD
jgi:hypothetical protein